MGNSCNFHFEGGGEIDSIDADCFKSRYNLGNRIAVGTFAIVKHCVRISDGKEFAVKIVKKSGCTLNEISLLRDEIHIYSSISHPHIIKLEDVFENNQTVSMVLELCNDQNLSDIMISAPNCRLKESDCSVITSTIASTLKYLHKKQIVHRDLKPENILFTKDGVLKITDFGSAHLKNIQYIKHSLQSSLNNSFRMNTPIGTPNYVAPEVLKGCSYSYRVDLWSLGVILFECLSGYHPFSTRRTRKSIGKLYATIIAGQYKMERIWDIIDNDAAELVKQLIVVDPKKRLNTNQILLHPFIVKYSDNKLFEYASQQTNKIVESVAITPKKSAAIKPTTTKSVVITHSEPIEIILTPKPKPITKPKPKPTPTPTPKPTSTPKSKSKSKSKLISNVTKIKSHLPDRGYIATVNFTYSMVSQQYY